MENQPQAVSPQTPPVPGLYLSPLLLYSFVPSFYWGVLFLFVLMLTGNMTYDQMDPFIRRELFPEINSNPTSSSVETLRFIRVFENEELYISLLQLSTYRPMELDGITKSTQGRHTNVCFRFNCIVNAHHSMTVKAKFTARNPRYHDVSLLKGRRETTMLSTNVQKINDIWYCVDGTHAFRALTRDFAIGQELWRFMVGTRTDSKYNSPILPAHQSCV